MYCNICKKKTTIMKFVCKYCAKVHCVSHQLPEEHMCENKELLKTPSKQIIEMPSKAKMHRYVEI